MIVGSMEIRIYAPMCHSLKDKRMIVRKLMDGASHRFNISIAEVADMDLLQSIVLGIACVSNSQKHTEQMLDTVLSYIGERCEGEIVSTVVDFN